jgi:hypothetical protein
MPVGREEVCDLFIDTKNTAELQKLTGISKQSKLISLPPPPSLELPSRDDHVAWRFEPLLRGVPAIKRHPHCTGTGRQNPFLSVAPDLPSQFCPKLAVVTVISTPSVSPIRFSASDSCLPTTLASPLCGKG